MSNTCFKYSSNREKRTERREEGIEGRKEKCEVQPIKKDWEMLIDWCQVTHTRVHYTLPATPVYA